jgi:mono/diheme cytochrome c family protein
MEYTIMTKAVLKLTTIALFGILVIFFFGFRTTPVTGAASAAVEDPATTFKAKCAMCHTPTASKYYDATVPEADQINAILKGAVNKDQTAPIKKMPGFEEKGITADDAKALSAYMKSLKTAN